MILEPPVGLAVSSDLWGDINAQQQSKRLSLRPYGRKQLTVPLQVGGSREKLGNYKQFASTPPVWMTYARFKF